MTEDEIAVMDGGKCILQLRGVRPFLSEKYDIKKHPEYKNLAEAGKQNTFHIESVTKKGMIDPDEKMEVYNIEVGHQDN